MNWFKENPFLAGVIVFALIVLGVLGFFLSGAYTEFQTQEENYISKVTELHRLQNESPYPSEENLAQVRNVLAEYKEAVSALQTQVLAHQPELPENVTPQQFQDDLRRVVSEVTKLAEEAGVALPEDFYLGFDQYRANLPTDQATPELVRQLEVVKKIAGGLIAARVARINSFRRNVLPVETAQPRRNPDEELRPEDVVHANHLDISISGEQGRVRMALNTFLNSPQFLVIRALEFQNSSRTGPPRQMPGQDDGLEFPQPQETPDMQVSEQVDFSLTEGVQEQAPLQVEQLPGTDLPIVLGREVLTVRAKLELIEFAEIPLE